MNEIDLAEAQGFGGVTSLTGRRYKVRLIEGDRLGSSGYYPSEVLRRDGPQLYKADTPMFVNHQTAEEKLNRPFGAVHEYVGYLAEDAYYENDGLYADVEIFEDAAPMIKARMEKIGISIRGKAVAEDRVMNGKTVPYIKQMTEAKSVDFVMRAGAGGKIVSILESAIEDDTVSVEENGDNMDEVLKAIAALENKFDGRLTTLEESFKAIPVAKVETVEESAATVDPAAKALEIAEAFTGSTLDAEGRKRVLSFYKADGGDLSKLIEAEEAYVKKAVANTDNVGIEESAVEVEESAKKKITVPSISAWGKK